MRSRTISISWLRSLTACLALALITGGCAGEAGLPADGAPVVSSDSDAAKKAIAENEALLKKNQENEAKAFRKKRNAPEKIEDDGQGGQTDAQGAQHSQ